MCRMALAVGTSNPAQITQELIRLAQDKGKRHEHHEKHPYGTFQHPHGWGWATVSDRGLIIGKSILPVFSDTRTHTTMPTQEQHIRAFAIHARRASIGRLNVLNTHPFWRNAGTDFVALFHNGTIHEEIQYQQKQYGETDSERVLLGIVDRIQQRQPIENALLSIAKPFIDTESSLNLIVLSSTHAHVVSSYSTNPNYLQMCIGKNQDSVVVASECLQGIEGLSWETIPNHCVLSIDLHTLQIVTRSI